MKNSQILFFVLAVFVGIFIFYMSSISFEPSEKAFDIKPYIYHFGVFFMFSFFLFMSGRMKKEYLFVVVLISFVYALLDEVHQIYVPNRGFDIVDLGVDYLGVVVGFIFLLIFKNRKVFK